MKPEVRPCTHSGRSRRRQRAAQTETRVPGRGGSSSGTGRDMDRPTSGAASSAQVELSTPRSSATGKGSLCKESNQSIVNTDNGKIIKC